MSSLIERLYKAQAVFKESRGGVDYAVINDSPVAKVCTSCDEFKLLRDFSNRTTGVLEKMNHCKECVKRYKESLGRQYINELARKYRRKNPEKHITYYHNRRAKLFELPYTFSEGEKKETLNFFNNGCSLTGSSEYHWDHVIPLATGHGGTVFGNMIPLRADLNISKNNRNIFEWFEEYGERHDLSTRKFNELIEWLAEVNGMSVEEYRDYVYECHESEAIS